MKLSMEQIEKEMKVIADSGMEEILILTGESRSQSNVEYIGEACKLARKYFRMVGLEIYPVNTDEYKYLHECGADYVTVFQETYDTDKYEQLHLLGHKRVWPYRFDAQERALRGGMRGVAFSALLGLSDFRKDALASALHVYYLQRKYPHAEMSLSCPRLRPIINNEKINPLDVHEKQLCQIICAYRIFLPFVGITVSSRESAEFRNAQFRVLIAHHPLFDPSGAAPELVALFKTLPADARQSFDLMCAGHIHRYEKLMPGKVLYSTLPHRNGKKQKFTPPFPVMTIPQWGYFLIEKYSDKMVFKAFSPENTVLDSVTIPRK